VSSAIRTAHGSSGVIQGFRSRGGSLSGGLREVEEGLTREFGYARVGVTHESDQQSYPADLCGFNADYGNRLCHARTLLSSFRPSGAFREWDEKSDQLHFPEIHDSGGARDKKFVSPFLKHAEEIFQTAKEGGLDDCEMSILVSREGNIHMLAGADWELEPLRRHHGARAAYRISRKSGGVRLEARSADESCLLQTRQPARLLPALMPDFPQYLTIQ